MSAPPIHVSHALMSITPRYVNHTQIRQSRPHMSITPTCQPRPHVNYAYICKSRPDSKTPRHSKSYNSNNFFWFIWLKYSRFTSYNSNYCIIRYFGRSTWLRVMRSLLYNSSNRLVICYRCQLDTKTPHITDPPTYSFLSIIHHHRHQTNVGG